ncbi:putative zinc finger transcription factor ace1 [Xylogone sp. PMI_703]|nr:putative zinc finger transcription factor ace1 [Xylogone sp. PMI_703]
MSFTHPRRTTKTTSPALTPSSPTASSLCPTVNTKMSLRKGATFHSPSSSPNINPEQYFTVPALPRRSHSSLEDVVDAHKRRVALTLGDIDRSLAGLDDCSSTRPSFLDDSDPVPQGVLNHTVDTPATRSYGPIMEGAITQEPTELSIGRHSLRPRQNRRLSRHHASDSGLGSSIKSEIQSEGNVAGEFNDERGAKSIVSASAITRSAAAHSSTMEELRPLSSKATSRIHEHILKPLLAKPSLKDFRPIVKDVPRRILSKEIVCLRDLEKTLIFMAPVSGFPGSDVVGGVAHWFFRVLKERAKTAALYLDFCLTSIRCIQATVEFLSEREQTRPHDRPYTNGYFVDLVDQIKQYALQVKAAKEKEAKGEALGENDPEPTDEVKLHGGYSKNGRPAQLVRVKKNGKAISVVTGEAIDLDEDDSKSTVQMKRSLSQEAEDEEAIMRSMARRKRSASASELAPKRCSVPGCDREFKRPCDLTKHEKTHSRPWKCPVETCHYHEYGWPTEKEMGRHHNDKHSASPALYECHFKPCPYRSKRESNCKQHMEKAHGWTYVRSKNNGKNKPKAGQEPNPLPTPQTSNIRTPSSEGNSITTPVEQNYDIVFNDSLMFDTTHNSDISFPEYNQNIDFDLFNPAPPLQIDLSPTSDMNQSLYSSSSNTSPFDMAANTFDATPFQDLSSNNVDFSLFGENEDLYSANVQLPTPSHEVFQRMYDQQPRVIPYNAKADPIPHFSPVGHGNTMLYTPSSLREVDEGFEDFAPPNQLGADFQLFPTSTGGTVSSRAPSAFFGEITGQQFNTVPISQELLDFYAQTNVSNNANAGMMMDWTQDDQFSSGYTGRQ